MIGFRLRCVFMDGESFIREYLHHLFGNDVLHALSGFEFLVCEGVFSEAYMLWGSVASLVKRLMSSGRVPYMAGVYVGRVRGSRPRLLPSADFLSLLYSRLGRLVRAVVVGAEGLKPFLYGRDVLRASVKKCFDPLDRGEVVGVVGEDGFIYGVGLSALDSCRELQGLRAEDLVVENVFDVGWFIRGSQGRERKFRLRRAD